MTDGETCRGPIYVNLCSRQVYVNRSYAGLAISHANMQATRHSTHHRDTLTKLNNETMEACIYDPATKKVLAQVKRQHIASLLWNTLGRSRVRMGL